MPRLLPVIQQFDQTQQLSISFFFFLNCTSYWSESNAGEEGYTFVPNNVFLSYLKKKKRVGDNENNHLAIVANRRIDMVCVRLFAYKSIPLHLSVSATVESRTRTKVQS